VEDTTDPLLERMIGEPVDCFKPISLFKYGEYVCLIPQIGQITHSKCGGPSRPPFFFLVALSQSIFLLPVRNK
jgi:hypothetical protein